MKSPRCVSLSRMILRAHQNPDASLPSKEATHESSAISWGVCGRMVTLSNSTPVETTAMGFWLSER